MTGTQILILIIYLLILIFEFFLKFINLKYLKTHGDKLPPEFEGMIDENLLKKTKDYTFEKSKFSNIESIFDSIILIIFIFCGVLNIYNRWILSLNLSFILSGIIFFLLLSYASTFLSIPFSLYANFKIENKYGFNTMTWKLWISDFFKGLAISTILMGIILLLSLMIIDFSPSFWWLWVWLFLLLFGIFIMYISPYVIEPLFNKYVPVQEDGLNLKIMSLMDKMKIKISKIQVVDASKRSKHSNAYFTGIGMVKRIVLFDTLLKNLSHDEILAVLAHEAGHFKKKHVIKRIVMIEALSLAVLFIAHKILNSEILIEIFNLQTTSFFAKIILLGFIGSLIMFPLTPVASYFARKQENSADKFACEFIEKREDFSMSLIKLSKDNLANLYPHPIFAWFYYSHPPILKRIKEILNKT